MTLGAGAPNIPKVADETDDNFFNIGNAADVKQAFAVRAGSEY